MMNIKLVVNSNTSSSNIFISLISQNLGINVYSFIFLNDHYVGIPNKDQKLTKNLYKRIVFVFCLDKTARYAQFTKYMLDYHDQALALSKSKFLQI